MATKKNKAKKLSNRKESISKKPWPSLPQQLIQLPALKFIPMPCMSNLGKLKLWLTSSRCNKSEDRQWPQLSQWRIFKVEKNINRSHASWSYDTPFISAARYHTNCETRSAIRVELTYISSPALMVLCFNEHDECAWIRYECTTIDPFDVKSQRMQFTRIIGIDGKIYALSLQGALAVIEDVDSRLMITAVSSSRAVPSVISKYFKEFFVELNGEILLVFLIYRRSLEIVDEVEVFRLCFIKLKWIKVEKLQDKTLFLDRCCIWVNSAEVGCRGNSVYFTQGSDDVWWVYDMESGCISPAIEDNARIRD